MSEPWLVDKVRRYAPKAGVRTVDVARLPMIRVAPPQPALPPPMPKRDWLRVASGVSLAQVLETVSFVTGVSIKDMRSGRRMASFVRARMIYYDLARRHTAKSLPHIGKFVSKDHSTVLHGIRCVRDRPERFEPEMERAQSIICKQSQTADDATMWIMPTPNSAHGANQGIESV